ncbi:unnamed protein product, partial [Protopolystoma xenopodis]
MGDLSDYFSQFGIVKSCTIKIDKTTGQPRGFGFVIFSTDDAIDKVLAINSHRLNNRKIDPKVAKPTRDQQRKVFVGGLDPNTLEHVESIDLPYDGPRGRRKEFAFITFASEDDAKRAASKDQQEIQGRMCDVRIAVHRDPKPRPLDFSKTLNIYTNGLNVAAAVYQQQQRVPVSASVGVVPHQTQSTFVPPHYIYNSVTQMPSAVPSWISDPSVAAMLLHRYPLFSNPEYSRSSATAFASHYAAAMGLNPGLVHHLPSASHHPVTIPQSSRINNFPQLHSNCDSNPPHTVQQHTIPGPPGLLLVPNVSPQTSVALLNNSHSAAASMSSTLSSAPIPVTSNPSDTNVAYAHVSTGSSGISPYSLHFYMPPVQGPANVSYPSGVALAAGATPQASMGFSSGSVHSDYAFTGSGMIDPNTFLPPSIYPSLVGQKPQPCLSSLTSTNPIAAHSLSSASGTPSAMMTAVTSPCLTASPNIQQLASVQVSPLDFYVTPGFQQHSNTGTQQQANLPYLSQCNYPIAGVHPVVPGYPLLSLSNTQSRLPQIIPQAQIQNGSFLPLVGDVPGSSIRSHTGTSPQQNLIPASNETQPYNFLQQRQLHQSQSNSLSVSTILDSSIQQHNHQSSQQHHLPASSNGGLCFPLLVPLGVTQNKVTAASTHGQPLQTRPIGLMSSGFTNQPSNFPMIVPTHQPSPSVQVSSSLLQQPSLHSNQHLSYSHTPGGIPRLWPPGCLQSQNNHINSSVVGARQESATSGSFHGAYNYHYHLQPCQHQPNLHSNQSHYSAPQYPIRHHHCSPRHQNSGTINVAAHSLHREIPAISRAPKRVLVVNCGVGAGINYEHIAIESSCDVDESSVHGESNEATESEDLHLNGDVDQPDSVIAQEVANSHETIKLEHEDLAPQTGCLVSFEHSRVHRSALSKAVVVENLA